MSDVKPTKKKLQEFTGGRSYATHMHPNPKFFKYYWRVFSNDSEYEGRDFFIFGQELTTAEYVAKTDALDARNEPYLIYNRRIPRRFEGMPFDPTSERWRGQKEWAPAWEEDRDAEFEGFK